MSSSFEYSIQRTRLCPACSRYTCRNYHKLLANMKKQGIQFHTRQSYWTGSKRLMIIKLSSAALVKTYMYTSVYIYGPETSLRITRIARKIVGGWTHTLPEYSYKLHKLKRAHVLNVWARAIPNLPVHVYIMSNEEHVIYIKTKNMYSDNYGGSSTQQCHQRYPLSQRGN